MAWRWSRSLSKRSENNRRGHGRLQNRRGQRLWPFIYRRLSGHGGRGSARRYGQANGRFSEIRALNGTETGPGYPARPDSEPVAPGQWQKPIAKTKWIISKHEIYRSKKASTVFYRLAALFFCSARLAPAQGFARLYRVGQRSLRGRGQYQHQREKKPARTGSCRSMASPRSPRAARSMSFSRNISGISRAGAGLRGSVPHSARALSCPGTVM